MKISKELIINLIIFLGILLRFVFIIFTPIYSYQMDSIIPTLNSQKDYENLYTTTITRTIENDDGSIYKLDDAGHFNYCMYIYHNWHLPATNTNQYYHPPLNAFLSAIWLKALDFTPFSMQFKIEALQFLPFLYSSISIIFIKKILNKFEISKNTQIFIMLICSFCPIFVVFSGSLTNDALVTLFSIMSIYLLINWYQSPTLKNILLISLSLGLGAITKHSILVNYILCGGVFIKKLIQTKNRKFLWHFLLFLYVLLPITFAYPIRNYILFNQIPFSVQSASKSLYTGNYSLWEQFKPFDKTLLNPVFSLNDHNVFSMTIGTSVNPFMFLKHYYIVVEYIISITLLLISTIGIISLLQTQKNNIHIKFSVYTTSLWIFSFVLLNLTMPYSCSSSARYIFTPIIFLSIQLGFILDYSKSKKRKKIIKLLSVIYSIIAIMIIISYICHAKNYQI